MFENLGWGEVLVLLVAGLFILGPERLPEAAAWLARSLRQVKEMVGGAREQLRSELGPDFDEFRKPFEDLREPLDELRSMRAYDPRRSIPRSLFADDLPAGPNGAAGTNGVTGPNGSAAHPRAGAPRPLAAGERPPIDPDAT